MEKKKVHVLQAILLILTFFFQLTFSQKKFCGKIPIQTPFSNQISNQKHTLKQRFFCKSEKLYFKNSLGVFQISSINYRTKLLKISHKSISPSSRFIGFENPSKPNSLFRFNCSNKMRVRKTANLRNCPWGKEGKHLKGFSCLIVGFHPNEMNCSDYKTIDRKHGLIEGKERGFKVRSRVSVEVENHVPNPCDECEKDNGNCGVALRCICHPKMCREKVISLGTKVKHLSQILIMFLICISFLILV